MDPAATGAAASSDGGAFLEFVDYAISVLSSSGSDGDGYESLGDGPAPERPPWGWAVAQVLKSCCAYSSGVTAAILLSDLFQVNFVRSCI
uniref:Cell division control protein 24 OB domain-containing protein n=1 Tax=Arundo donax TaxID=35708 RepID=A0A0A9C6W7_ARUDO